jgi:signal transduction histidine kinase
VAAEIARVTGQAWQATQCYEQAIVGAKKHEYIQEEALSYELAARFYLAHKMEKIASTYLTEAYQRYQHWGAGAKLRHLEKHDAYWLNLPQRSPGGITATATIAPLTTRVHTTRLATSTDWMDLSSVMKAAQALSDEMVLENLLMQMMHTVIENAGAQRGVLILEHQDQWLVQAEATVQPEQVTVLQALPLAGRLPLSVFNYVIRTKQSVVFAELQREMLYKDDEYVRAHQPKSVLCITLLHQQKLVGVIYLENNLTTDAFTPDRAQVLTLLSSQMAISLDNARFVNELEQARHAAEAANQAKTAFLSNVSHELRTPLNGILGYAQLLQQDPDLSAEQKEFIDTIYRSGEHLLVMVSDILDISKLQTAQLELHLTDLYLPHLITDLVGWFQDQAREKGLNFHYESDEQLPRGIVVDAKRLRQILHHLLSNAVKFTQQGSITFRVHLLPETTPERHQLQFIVTDTGMGVLETTLSKLFSPFEQATDWLHKSAGAGLGLSLAKQLVELMGGKITVHSQVGEGSTFTVQLECEKSQEWQLIDFHENINNATGRASGEKIAAELVDIQDDVPPIKGPSAEKARELLHLAMMGDFFGMLEWATELEQEDEELHPFVEKIRQWARNFQDDPIEKLVRQFVDSV